MPTASHGSFHVVSDDTQSSGERLAITVMHRPGTGLVAWAGLLRANAALKTAEEIESDDYLDRQSISFAAWFAVWPYFAEQREFSPLIARLQEMVSMRLGESPNPSSFPR